jgi:hypothetical protein
MSVITWLKLPILDKEVRFSSQQACLMNEGEAEMEDEEEFSNQIYESEEYGLILNLLLTSIKYNSNLNIFDLELMFMKGHISYQRLLQIAIKLS